MRDRERENEREIVREREIENECVRLNERGEGERHTGKNERQ